MPEGVIEKSKTVYFKDMELSALGFGMMRLPLVEGGHGDVDEAKVREMVDCALAHGVNYFDTAYIYHEGYGLPLRYR